MSPKVENLILGTLGVAFLVAGVLVTPVSLYELFGNELVSTSARFISWTAGLCLGLFGLILWLRKESVSLKKLVGFASYALFLIAMSELLLQFAALLNPRWDFILSGKSAMVPDAELHFRPSPFHPEHDANGFRNDAVPSSVAVVALGDSQTYGYNAAREEAWPQQLAVELQEPTYNMAAGGYSPPVSLALIDEAIALGPNTILFALYSGNDLHESFSRVYLHNVSTQLAAAAPDQVDSMLREEHRLRTTSDQPGNNQTAEKILKVPGLLLAIFRMTNAMFGDKQRHWHRYVLAAQRKGEFVFDVPPNRTIFTAEKRLLSLDMSNQRIQEGYRIALTSMQAMHAEAARNGINFFVVLIPTKELVYADIVTGLESYPVPGNYRTLVETEEAFWQRVTSDLDRNKIAWIDSLKVLRSALHAGEAIYSSNSDGHPTAAGYRAIALNVAARLKEVELVAHRSGDKL